MFCDSDLSKRSYIYEKTLDLDCIQRFVNFLIFAQEVLVSKFNSFR